MAPSSPPAAGLDLAARARLSVNALVSSFKPELFHAVTQTFRFGALPPFDASPNWMPMKFLRALPLVRGACGSDDRLDIEKAAMEAMVAQIGQDGHLYLPISVDGPPGGTAYPAMSGLAVLALLEWHRRDGDPRWRDCAARLVAGLKTAAIDRGDYAFIPPECSLGRDGRWHWTLRGQGWPPGYIPYAPPQEPVAEQQGWEGAVKWEQSYVIKAMVRWHGQTGDEAALDHARKLVAFCLKPQLWDEGGPDSGAWSGHFHGNMGALQALLAFALATGDVRIQDIVRSGYQHGRERGAIRFGFVPSWIDPERVGRPASAACESEGCGAADTLVLASTLSDAGLGDSWDDVEALVRNHFGQLQMTDLDRIKAVAGAGPEWDASLSRVVGGFTQARLTCNHNSTTHGCCTGNGALALYTAWEGITRFADGVAHVNLFLDRISPWLEVRSLLPHQGRVFLRNKQADVVRVRLPSWLRPLADRISCSVHGSPATPGREGPFLTFAPVSPGDRIELSFPLPEARESCDIGAVTYTAKIRANAVLDISPHDCDSREHRRKYPFFR